MAYTAKRTKLTTFGNRTHLGSPAPPFPASPAFGTAGSPVPPPVAVPLSRNVALPSPTCPPGAAAGSYESKDLGVHGFHQSKVRITPTLHQHYPKLGIITPSNP